MKQWRLLDTGPRCAAVNMALDDVIIKTRSEGSSPNTIRLLQFDPAAVLVGYHQAVEQEIRMDYCKEKRIDINRRITGGGAIYFDKNSLGWEIIASKSEMSFQSTSEQLYRHMSMGTIYALDKLGINASFRPKNDIEVNGRKISGTGGTEQDNTFLFQGTLLIDFDVDTMLRTLKIPLMKLKDKEVESVKERVTSIKEELGRVPNLEIIKEALKEGFERNLQINLKEGELTIKEQTLLREKADFFRSNEWIFLDRRSPNLTVDVQALQKTPGGLIRVSLTLDRERDYIERVLITGDFFVFPSRAILDLEARLKGISNREKEINKIVYDFFETTETQIPGVHPKDIIDLIREAIKKTEYEKLGISLADTNHVYTVNGDALDILKKGCDFILLPYCAKLVSCIYRYQDGCTKCGECSIGSVYEMAEKAGLRIITIQSFEHLMITLDEFREKNVKGYIGCCCEGFYCKHQDDLKQSQVPGIFVDIDDRTCYDLGKEREALEGTFESQTELKVDLLSKFLDLIHKDSKE